MKLFPMIFLLFGARQSKNLEGVFRKNTSRGFYKAVAEIEEKERKGVV